MDSEQTVPAPKKSSIRTMVGDTERVLKSEKISAIGLLTQREQGRIIAESADERNRKIIWAVVGLVAVVIAAGIGFFILTAVRPAPAPVNTPPKSAIPATQNDTVALDMLDHAAFIAQWNELEKKPLLPSEFRSVTILNKPSSAFLGVLDFLNLAQIAPPSTLTNTLRDPFTLGIIRTERGNETVFIFTVRAFAETLAGMLAWEKNLPQALANLLPPDRALAREARGFEDAVIANHDVRFIKNTGGDATLFYTIFNRQTLVITESREALEAILRQLSFFPPQ